MVRLKRIPRADVLPLLNGLRPRRGVVRGQRVRIAPGVRFDGSGTKLGPHVRILRGGEILGPAEIGARTFINRDVYVRAHIVIGADVSIGPFVHLVSDSHEFGPSERRAGVSSFDPITIGNGCWLGADVTVLGGVTIGDGAVIAAGSVVTRDVPANWLYAGIPARPVRQLT